MKSERLPHIMLTEMPEKLIYTSNTPGGGSNPLPSRNRQSHCENLIRNFTKAWEESESELATYQIHREGVYLEFRGKAGYELATTSLESIGRKNIRLCNIRTEDEPVVENGQVIQKPMTYATVYVPNNQREFFANRIEAYGCKENNKSINRDRVFPKYEAYKETISNLFVDVESVDKLKIKEDVSNVDIEGLLTKGVPSDLINLLKKTPKNQKLVEGIEDIRKALLIRSFWQDNENLIPDETPQWCEVWISTDEKHEIEVFETLLDQQNIESKSGFIRFPERTVKVVKANEEQLKKLTRSSSLIAEYRRAKETSSYWMDLEPRHQTDWIENLKLRLKVNENAQTSICILDTGVNSGHPLLSPVISEEDCHSVDLSWGVHDHDKHGTLMAGVAAYGDLGNCLSNNEELLVRHSLESVKILPKPPNSNDPDIWGEITAQGVSKAEIQAPDRNRITCLAVTAKDSRDRGRPTSWSGAVDQLCSGANEEDDIKRLIIISAGNVNDMSLIQNYPDVQITDSVHDPAQSWNALTVGAITNLGTITDPSFANYIPIAPEGGLSPFSTCSIMWDDKWPIKPEILMEGGNLAKSDSLVSTCDDLCQLSTFYKPTEGHFYPFSMTSAATAQASWFAAQVQSEYPDYWPETIRALMVHSAEWPEKLKEQFLKGNSKTAYKNLLKVCGYGVPDLEKALYSAKNSLTLISQATLQPFARKEGTSSYKTKDMDLYDLPWPDDVLLQLPPETQINMKVTLSYFIEPGPGEIGWKDRYRYASHALRFDIKSPTESKNEFVRRINKAARSEELGHPNTESASKYWLLGDSRNKGSIHSDIWQGTAADLATSNIISVSPIIGWWRERHHLGRWNSKARYSLIVSINSPELDIDIYTPVATKVGITVPVAINI